MTVEEAQAILDNLSEKRLIVSNDRAGTKWYWLLAWVDGVWETHLPECDDLAFIEAGTWSSRPRSRPRARRPPFCTRASTGLVNEFVEYSIKLR